MNRTLLQVWTVVVAGLALPLISASQTTAPQPLVIPLDTTQGSRDLLIGTPQTAGMRSGFVRLKPGETVGWHTTGAHEETLVILHGQGSALIEGQSDRPFVSPAVTYIPPATRHDIKNTGSDVLEYVYVVAPAGASNPR